MSGFKVEGSGRETSCTAALTDYVESQERLGEWFGCQFHFSIYIDGDSSWR